MSLLRLALAYLRPYYAWVAAVVVLQSVATIASLYLPSLNARIIDQGVAQGDTDFICSTLWSNIIPDGRRPGAP